MTFNLNIFFSILILFVPCQGQIQNLNEIKTGQNNLIHIGQKVSQPGENIDCIFQDKSDNYWFASNGEGIYRYDGKTTVHITVKDGLCSNFVWNIIEDITGNLWFVTRDGICKFDGRIFTNYTNIIRTAPFGKLSPVKGGIFFNHPDGICFYNGISFTNFTIHPGTYTPDKSSTYRPYGVYCTLIDNSGRVWFGTQDKGVCVYDNGSFVFIDAKDLMGHAVRSIYEDKNGILWFGNNGGGFYRYDGKTLRNITEEKNLVNYEFLKELKPVDKPGSLARVFAINEDLQGNIWIGTVDAGVWKYDGNNLTNFTDKDGLSGNSVSVIYKDKKGKLWFVANGDTIFNFDGQKFSKFVF